jgi:DNA-binding MarR family transcriptional regulator
MSLTALAELVDLDRSTLGRNLRVLEKSALVLLGSGKDQREQVASLTELGRDRLAAGDPLWERAQAGIANRIGVDGARQLEALLGAL